MSVPVSEARGRALTGRQLSRLEAAGRRRRFERGEVVLRQGEVGGQVVAVRAGYVKVTTHNPEGAEVVLAVVGPGDVLGEVSALDGRPRSATVTALGPVQAVVVAGDALVEMLRAEPELADGLLRVMAGRLRDTDADRAPAATVAGRVAQRLLGLADRFGVVQADHTVVIPVPITQDELAAWVGASREVTNRVLSDLRAQGWVRTGRRAMALLDRAPLERLAAR